MVMAISQSFIALLREVFQCFVTLFINGLDGKSFCLILIIKSEILKNIETSRISF